MDNKKRIILLIAIGGLIILTLSLGLTYAFMKVQTEKKEDKSNITINACAKIQLKDNGKFINLENTYPMDDDKGLETKPYEFTITSTCDNYVGFNLYLTTLTTNEIDDNAIHFAITSKNDNLLVSDVLRKDFSASSEFNTDELKELDLGIKGTHKNIYKVYSNNVPLKDESEYKLYLWVDKNISKDTTMDKTFTVGLSIKSFNRVETGVEKLISTVNEDETLYYHDASLTGGAEDDSYRYAGSSEEVQNFVCLDGGATTEGKCANDDADLYRIIGLFKNDLNLYEMKLIKYDYATIEQLGTEGAYKTTYDDVTSYYKGNKENLNNIAGYYWLNSDYSWLSSDDNINEWVESKLRNLNLNDYYLNSYLKTKKKVDIDKLIMMHTWSINGQILSNVSSKVMYDNEMNKVESSPNRPTKTKTVDDKIGLIYASDYGYASTPSSIKNWAIELNNTDYTLSNWLYMGLDEWTISRNSLSNTHAYIIYSSGFVGSNYVYDGDADKRTSANAVRPTFYITSSAKINESGNGSYEQPYRVTI